MKKIFLVDASSMFFRAFYAIRPLTSPSGLPTNAIYGFLSMILKLMREEKPDYMVFCYDLKEPSFRKDLYSEYKANRSETPEDLSPQIPYIKKIAHLLGIPSFEKPGYEADDIIGIITHFAREKGMEVYIVSGDKDFGQLVAEHVYLYDTMKEIKYDPKGVKEKWGVHPHQIIDYLAIVGDTSDNVPGIQGLGPKGAQKLLEEYGTLENIYAHVDEMKSESIKLKLKNNKEMAFLSKTLVTIKTEMDMNIQLEDLHTKPVHKEELRALLLELNFKSLEKTIFNNLESSSSGSVEPKSSVETPTVSDSKPTVIKNDRFVEKTLDKDELAIWLKDKIEIWLMPNERGIYLACKDDVITVGTDINSLRELLDASELSYCGFNIKDALRDLGCKKIHISWDLQLAAYVLKAGEIKDFNFVYEQFKHQTLPELATASDIYLAHLELREAVLDGLKKNELLGIYEDLEKPLGSVLFYMEQKGIRLDTEQLKIQSQELASEIEICSKKIYEQSGEVFNIASPKQLSFVLFEKLKLPVIKKTKTGYSTDNEVLEKLAPMHEIAHLLVDYREMMKLKSTYVDALPLLVDAQDGRLHTHFNQALTMTGRLSSTNPNLQNIPIRTERGARIRKAMVAEKGKLLLSADYSQIELRILAHITEDPGLCHAFQEDLDIHSATASEVFNVKLNQVTADLRRTAKAVNFGIAYGQGAFGLSEQLGISRSEAADIITKYFQKFSKVKQYMEDIVKQAIEKNYVETLFGRRRYIDEIRSKNAMIRKFGERAAINAPIQGTASDIVKLAMLRVFREVDLDLLLQVHDELILEGPEDKVRAEEKKVLDVMQEVYKLKVPMKVNVHIGHSWDEAH